LLPALRQLTAAVGVLADEIRPTQMADPADAAEETAACG
jgi:hypothetical protein